MVLDHLGSKNLEQGSPSTTCWRLLFCSTVCCHSSSSLSSHLKMTQTLWEFPLRRMTSLFLSTVTLCNLSLKYTISCVRSCLLNAQIKWWMLKESTAKETEPTSFYTPKSKYPSELQTPADRNEQRKPMKAELCAKVQNSQKKWKWNQQTSNFQPHSLR